MNIASRYGQTQAETASKERLMVLLFEAALRHMRAGALALEEGRRAHSVEPLAKASEIVATLHSTLNPSVAGELCEKLGELYRFVCRLLGEAQLSGEPKKVREAEKIFVPLVESFAQAVKALPISTAEAGR